MIARVGMMVSDAIVDLEAAAVTIEQHDRDGISPLTEGDLTRMIRRIGTRLGAVVAIAEASEKRMKAARAKTAAAR